MTIFIVHNASCSKRMGPDGGFLTGSDLVMDGGAAAAYCSGELAPK